MKNQAIELSLHQLPWRPFKIYREDNIQFAEYHFEINAIPFLWNQYSVYGMQIDACNAILNFNQGREREIQIGRTLGNFKIYWFNDNHP